MAFAPSLSVSVECVNICKFTKGEGSGRYDCSMLSCAWKAPRVLTGFLASTANPSHSSPFGYARHGRRNRIKPALDVGGWCSTDVSEFILLGKLYRSSVLHVGCKRWQLCSSSSFSSDNSNDISPESLWEGLKPAISYLSSNELELVHNALKLAFEAHDGQKRRSGEPFIIHPVEVARILGELELDWESIAAGLLHDTVEDTNIVTFQRIEEEFGPTVRRIVEGETKVSKLGKLKYKNENDSVQDVKADDLQQMFLAMTEEVRVIIVKLADRLHNIRTLSICLHVNSPALQWRHCRSLLLWQNCWGCIKLSLNLKIYPSCTQILKIMPKWRRIADLYKEHEKELMEVIEHKPYPYDHKANVFSFRIVLWELLTGKLPYEYLTPLQAAVGVVQKVCLLLDDYFDSA